MLKRGILVAGLLALGLSSFAQDIGIRGQIIDKNTGKPIAQAHVAAPSGVVAVTDESGFFTLNLNALPSTIRMTHVSYGTSEYEVLTKPTGLIVISIEQRLEDLGEVQITGERLRILTLKDPFSIQEFAIDRNVIWFLGFMHNQANQKRLFLANLYGDTLASVPVTKAEKLYQDVFNNVHIVFKDTVYQLFNPDGGSIRLLYPVARDRFFRIMDDIRLSYAQKLVYSREPLGSHNVTLYYIQQDDPVQYQLAVMSDSVAADMLWVEAKTDRLMAQYGIPELISIWTTIYRYTKRGTRFDRVIRQPVPYELFKSANTLYLVNYFKDSLLAYSEDGRLESALPIDFHKETSTTGWAYKDLTCLTDPVTQKVYLVERKISKWVVRPLNPVQGTCGQEIPLPDYPGMDGITAYGNALYFIYPEKQYPYYNRLYRYQLAI
jgi:hypothetical protein